VFEVFVLRGSELQNYFTRIIEDNLKAIIKPQYVDHIPKAVKGNVGEIMRRQNQRGVMEWVLGELDLNHVLDRSVEVLSGGELQRYVVEALSILQPPMMEYGFVQVRDRDGRCAAI
jgi:ATP-binding cassette subfamily E protein 1